MRRSATVRARGDGVQVAVIPQAVARRYLRSKPLVRWSGQPLGPGHPLVLRRHAPACGCLTTALPLPWHCPAPHTQAKQQLAMVLWSRQSELFVVEAVARLAGLSGQLRAGAAGWPPGTAASVGDGLAVCGEAALHLTSQI